MVVVGIQYRALFHCRNADEPFAVAAGGAGVPGLHIVDVCARLLGEQREDIHRLREGVRGDTGDAAVIGDADNVGCLTVSREDAMAQLGSERLQTTVGEVNVLRQTLLELHAAALLLAP